MLPRLMQLRLMQLLQTAAVDILAAVVEDIPVVAVGMPTAVVDMPAVAVINNL